MSNIEGEFHVSFDVSIPSWTQISLDDLKQYISYRVEPFGEKDKVLNLSNLKISRKEVHEILKGYKERGVDKCVA